MNGAVIEIEKMAPKIIWKVSLRTSYEKGDRNEKKTTIRGSD